MSGFGSLKLIKLLIVFSLACVYLFLSASAFTANLARDDSFISNNIFSSLSDDERSEYQIRQASLQQRLEFMVFEDERVKLQKQLLDVMVSRINNQPYDAMLWRDLVFAQTELNSTTEDRSWSFLVWKNMHQWNRHEQINQISRCAFFVNTPKSDEVSSACAELLSRVLLTQKASSLAHTIKLSKQEFSELASHYGVEFNMKEW